MSLRAATALLSFWMQIPSQGPPEAFYLFQHILPLPWPSSQQPSPSRLPHCRFEAGADARGRTEGE